MAHLSSIVIFSGSCPKAMTYIRKTLIESLVRKLVIIGRLYKWSNLDGVISAARYLVWVKLISLARTGGLTIVTIMMSVVAE